MNPEDRSATSRMHVHAVLGASLFDTPRYSFQSRIDKQSGDTQTNRLNRAHFRISMSLRMPRSLAYASSVVLEGWCLARQYHPTPPLVQISPALRFEQVFHTCALSPRDLRQMFGCSSLSTAVSEASPIPPMLRPWHRKRSRPFPGPSEMQAGRPWRPTPRVWRWPRS